MPIQEKYRFFFRNLIKGLLWLSIIIIIFFYVKKQIGDDFIKVLVSENKNFGFVMLVFIFSELLFGLIPPELFMIYALGYDSLNIYLQIVILLSCLSYLAGIAGFFFGKTLSGSKLYFFVQSNFLGKYEKYVYKFGGFLVIVAALTPIPYSGVSMLIGAVKFPIRKFLAWSLFRFLRFLVYAMVIWETNLIKIL